VKEQIHLRSDPLCIKRHVTACSLIRSPITYNVACWRNATEFTKLLRSLSSLPI